MDGCEGNVDEHDFQRERERERSPHMIFKSQSGRCCCIFGFGVRIQLSPFWPILGISLFRLLETVDLGYWA